MQDFNFPKVILKEGNKGYDGLDHVRKMAYLAAMSGKVGNLLSVGNDAKTIKGEPFGVRTAVLYMAPANVSGYEVCPSRTKGCSKACLFTAGQGRFRNVKQGRLRRTYQFLFRRQEFLEVLAGEISKYRARAIKDGKQFCVRLNGTSDIDYESYPLTVFGERYKNIFSVFSGVQFYDYTKRIERLPWARDIPNYHLTFSRGDGRLNSYHVNEALRWGVNVTVVFRSKLPPTWKGFPVVDGDRHDIRFWPELQYGGGPVIIGLLAKGEAKKDKTGFVVD